MGKIRHLGGEAGGGPRSLCASSESFVGSVGSFSGILLLHCLRKQGRSLPQRACSGKAGEQGCQLPGEKHILFLYRRFNGMLVAFVL